MQAASCLIGEWFWHEGNVEIIRRCNIPGDVLEEAAEVSCGDCIKIGYLNFML